MYLRSLRVRLAQLRASRPTPGHLSQVPFARMERKKTTQARSAYHLAEAEKGTTMRLIATIVWILAASLAIGFGVVSASDPIIDTWHGQTNYYCPAGRICS